MHNCSKKPWRLTWLLLSYRNELANVGDILMIHGEARGTGSLTSCQSLAEGNGIRKKQNWTCAGKEYSVETCWISIFISTDKCRKFYGFFLCHPSFSFAVAVNKKRNSLLDGKKFLQVSFPSTKKMQLNVVKQFYSILPGCEIPWTSRSCSVATQSVWERVNVGC